jgi:hypothetical protein
MVFIGGKLRLPGPGCFSNCDQSAKELVGASQSAGEIRVARPTDDEPLALRVMGVHA